MIPRHDSGIIPGIVGRRNEILGFTSGRPSNIHLIGGAFVEGESPRWQFVIEERGKCHRSLRVRSLLSAKKRDLNSKQMIFFLKKKKRHTKFLSHDGLDYLLFVIVSNAKQGSTAGNKMMPLGTKMATRRA